MTFKRLWDKLDKLDGRLDNMDKTLIKQEANLEVHMARSEANEEMVKILRDQIKPVVNSYDAVVIAGKVLIAMGGIGVAWKLGSFLLSLFPIN